MTEQTKPQHKVPLTDVMLAMDIADTLRHRDSIVAKELSQDEREKALFEKVKNTYASQGIEVSEATIREAIKAIDEERFAYQAPKKTLFTKFAHIYINRAKWTKGFAALAALGGIIWAGYFATVTYPEQRKLSKKVQALNQNIVKANNNEQSLQLRLNGLVEELNSAVQPLESELKTLFQRQKQQSFELLKAAATDIDIARPLRLTDDYDKNNYQELSVTALGQIEQQQKQLSQAKQKLDQAEVAIKHLHQLKILPNELLNLRNEASAIAKTVHGKNMAENFYQTAIANIKGLDFDSANNATSDLKDLIETLQQNYQLTIVSRQGMRTGLWREPDINQSARNYYILVEAINGKGQTLTLPIVNEENGSVSRVKIWGLRVEKNLYDRIARDKQDDGIVQNNIFGTKKSGYLKVDYHLPTTGKAITRW